MSEEFDTQVREGGMVCTKYELFSGKGTRIKPNGIKYIGEWKDGRYDGNGTITYPNGTKYIGEFKDGQSVPGLGSSLHYATNHAPCTLYPILLGSTAKVLSIFLKSEDTKVAGIRAKLSRHYYY